MGFLPVTQNCGLHMRWECREHFSRHRLQRKPLVSDPGMHHGTCVMHVPWYISGSLRRGFVENASGILGACATRNFTYLARGPWENDFRTTDPLRGESTGLWWIAAQMSSKYMQSSYQWMQMLSWYSYGVNARRNRIVSKITLIEIIFSEKKPGTMDRLGTWNCFEYAALYIQYITSLHDAVQHEYFEDNRMIWVWLCRRLYPSIF